MQSCNDSVRSGGVLVDDIAGGRLVWARPAGTRPANNKLAPILFIGKPDAARRRKVTKRLFNRCSLGNGGVFLEQFQHLFVQHLVVELGHAFALLQIL